MTKIFAEEAKQRQIELTELEKYQNGGYICKICGLAFITEQALAAHIDSEHPESQHAEVF